MQIGTIWLDIETSSVCGAVGSSLNSFVHWLSRTHFSGENQWDYGTSGNLAHAMSIVSALQASGFNFGIYSSPGEWSTIFGSEGVVVDSSAPLWFATWNNVQASLLFMQRKRTDIDIPCTCRPSPWAHRLEGELSHSLGRSLWVSTLVLIFFFGFRGLDGPLLLVINTQTSPLQACSISTSSRIEQTVLSVEMAFMLQILASLTSV